MRPRRKIDWIKIPPEIVIPVIDKILGGIGNCGDSLLIEDLERMLHEIALTHPQYGSVPTDHLRHQVINLRKRNHLEKTTDSVNRGRRPLPPPPKHIQEYYESDVWRAKRIEFLEAWGYRCAVCNSQATDKVPIDVHHRTYERLGHEANTDCIPLCRYPCHDQATRRMRSIRKRKGGGETTPNMFE